MAKGVGQNVMLSCFCARLSLLSVRTYRSPEGSWSTFREISVLFAILVLNYQNFLWRLFCEKIILITVSVIKTLCSSFYFQNYRSSLWQNPENLGPWDRRAASKCALSQWRHGGAGSWLGFGQPWAGCGMGEEANLLWKEEFSQGPKMMEGTHQRRKAFQGQRKEGFYWKDGKAGYGAKWAGAAEGKSPPSVGCLNWMRQAVALWPWAKGHVAKVWGFWALPNMLSILEGPPAIHPNCLNFACILPGAPPCCPSPGSFSSAYPPPLFSP